MVGGAAADFAIAFTIAICAAAEAAVLFYAAEVRSSPAEWDETHSKFGTGSSGSLGGGSFGSGDGRGKSANQRWRRRRRFGRALLFLLPLQNEHQHACK